MSNNNLGILIILVIIAIALSGGMKNSNTSTSTTNGGFFSTQPSTPEQKQNNIQSQIDTNQAKVDELKKQLAVEEAKKNQSQYKGKISISYISRGSNASQEYIVLRTNNATTSTNVSGWILKSLSSGVSIEIPKATYLYFADTKNSESDIYLTKNDNLYLVTGISPNGASFKLNKCSGYLNQFQTFTPYLNSNCPAPRDEDLSSIPRTVNNDACLDYINSMSSCNIQTNPTPANFSYECTNFIYNKINYPSCVNTHKNDKDFYKEEWRVYLKRSEPIWKNSREDVVLLDQYGKIVDEYKY